MKNEIGVQFRHIINWVIKETWRHSGAIPHEPDYIANLVIKGTPQFHNIISFYPNIWGMVSTIGVFCHQSPMVKYTDDNNDEQRCELGDLLFCHFHKNKQGTTFRNALLFQSKLSDNYLLNIAYNDTQLKLYREWPLFKYYRSGKLLENEDRHLVPPLPHTGAQYMSIDNSPPANPLLGINTWENSIWPIGVTPVTPILSADTPLETELVRFLFSATGKPFDSYKNRNTDQWTKIVWDLLGNGFRKAFNRSRAGFNNTPRIGGIANADGLLNYLGNPNNIYDAFENDFMNEDFKSLFSEDVGNNTIKESPILDNDDVRSPSIIIFTTNEENNQKNQ